MKKKIIIISSFLILLVVGGLLWWVLPGTAYKQKNGTNTNAADKTIDLFYDELKEYYPQVYQRIPEKGRVTYTIPGLIQTATLIAEGSQEGEVDTAEDMTPQGMAFVEDYVVISAYSKSYKYNSVLWILEKTSGKFIKTVVLPTTSHVGGLAYDSMHKRLWVTTTDDQSDSQISALKLENILEDNFKETEEAIAFSHQFHLTDISKSSYMTYQDNALFVGYFDKDDLGHMGYFKLDDAGLPLKYDASEEGYRPSVIYDTAERVQGMAFLGNQVVFSQSYGNKDSKLLYFPNPGLEKWTNFEEDTAQDELVTPPYMQQIVPEGDALYLLFESSATKYRLDPTVTTIDRIIKIGGE